MSAPIVAVDIETDGLHPGRRAWEIAMIRRDFVTEEPELRPPGIPGPAAFPANGGWWVEREKRFFVGIDLQYSDPYGLQVGGFWDRHPVGRKLSGKEPAPGPSVEVWTKHAAASEVMRWTFGAHLVGVNPSFDAETLSKMLRAEGYVPSWHYHLIDVLPMAVGWLAAQPARWVASVDGSTNAPLTATEVVTGSSKLWQLAESATVERKPIGPPWKSDEVSRACGVEPPGDERHTALADARWALRWYDKLTGGAQ